MRWSLFAHVAIFALVMIKSLVFPGKPMLYVPTLRVDVVGLPDILKKDMSHLPKPPAGDDDKIAEALKRQEEAAKEKLPEPEAAAKSDAKEEADPDEMTLKSKAKEDKKAKAAREKEKREQEKKQREKKLKGALDRLKSLEKIKDEPAKKDSGLKGGTGAPGGVLIKGNKVSRGTSLSGDAVESAQASYFDSLRDKLQDNWSLPVWLARQDLSAQVLIFIDGYGRLRSFKFVKPSGNPQFDEAVKKTLQASQPFPAPPESLAAQTVSQGVLIGFPL